MYICIYICICVCVCVYIYILSLAICIYIYIEKVSDVILKSQLIITNNDSNVMCLRVQGIRH